MKVVLLVALLALSPLSGVDHSLDSEYTITYGDPTASTQIVEYFSFSCPYCVELFNQHFPTIRSKYLDDGSVCWTFHPIPVDLPTVQAMACLRLLSPAEKRIFLEEVLQEVAEPGGLDIALLMEKVVEVFGKQPAHLQDFDALEEDPAFRAAFEFVRDGLEILGVPSVQIDGQLMEGEVPSKEFIDLAMTHICTQEEDLCVRY